MLTFELGSLGPMKDTLNNSAMRLLYLNKSWNEIVLFKNLLFENKNLNKKMSNY
jgi:hypothetical protein